MNITSDVLNRKGATKIENIPTEVLQLLNLGRIETVNLTEWLAVNHAVLVTSVFPEMSVSEEVINKIVLELKQQKKASAMNSVKIVGGILYKEYVNSDAYEKLFQKLNSHISDSVRCYATYFLALNKNISVEDKFLNLKSLISDAHFGVREVVWMALRKDISENLDFSLKFLSNWAESENENVRRFCTESTRPRGVWCSHIDQLKEKPELALPILEKLKSDSSKYVQDSVGNWLNDASKTRPDFVTQLCERWKKESPTKSTQYIVKKALRTILKK
ncbi:DNA alkylation repair protein [Capnocytophaga stomatis]|uniref:DNA alkylation repair protein n=1 Tax=Capnocytophaga stomatis TaxID=1848904 RepID=A0ABW8QDE9_9FLAO|nr:DNA alkylation repair protein [Capnocytophaga stomatis]